MTCTDFRTTFTSPAPPFGLNPEQGALLLIGSCFTDEVGERLRASGYPCSVNPCGVQYNPASIASLLRAALSGELAEELFFEHEGRWRCWLVPTRFSAPLHQEAKELCSKALGELREALQGAEALIVTLGTAWVYTHVAPGFEGVVSNCHKVPAPRFSRSRLSVEQIAAEWRDLLRELREFNPALKVIFTVSPIRHFKDGARENTLSKATLALAIDSLMDEEAVDYFPAYELLMDDLRDYRFYAPDMLHPSPVAVDYIWQHFRDRYFSATLRDDLTARARTLRRAAHRPIIH
ncbi:MAG: GSCFA domain-containing protein [Bacteroidales bacterium]|nr:GSCFA domain-containing protein [Bacteroidales bacterium]